MKILLTIAAVGLLVALVPVANAEVIQIQYQVDLGPIVTCTFPLPGPVTCLNVVGPPIRILGLGANSNSPGTSTLGDLTAADIDLMNNSTSSHQIQIQISANDFVAPTGSVLSLLSHIGGTVVTGTGTFNDLSFQSCIDPSNALRSVGSLGVACPVGAFASGVAAPTIAGSGSFDVTKGATIGPLVAPYAINEAFVLDLAPGEELNWSSSTTLTPAVPEPASILLLGTGLLGLGAFRRRRVRE